MLSKLWISLFGGDNTDFAEDLTEIPALNDGDLHHFAITRINNQWKVYMDGVLMKSGNTNAQRIFVDIDSRIGRSHFDSFDFNGLLKHVRFYNVGLTAGEVEELFTEGR